MRKLLLVGSFALACISSISAQIRFVDNVIDRSKVSVTKNVTYAQNYTVLYGDMDTTKAGPQFMLESLKMDIYAPNDGSSNRPLIIYLHTGSFLPRYINNTPTGAKDDSATVEMCYEFARKGYVVASIAYRQGWDPRSLDENVRRSTIINAAYKGVQDLHSCIRWWKENAAAFGNTFSVDTTKYCVGGQGTGSYITSAYAALDRQGEITINKFRDPSTGAAMVMDAMWGDRYGYGGITVPTPQGGPFNKVNTPGHSSDDAKIAFQIGGALGDSSWLEKGEIPMLWSHSVNDPFAPYTTGMVNVPGTTLQVVEVSGGYDVMDRADKFGNNDVFKGKVMDDYTRAINKVNNGIDGLYPIVGLVNASGPYEWWDTAAIKMLPKQFYPVDAILAGAKATNPFMSKSRALLFVDSLQRYFSPRMAVAMGLVESVGINKINWASNVTVAPNPAKNHLTLHNNWENNNLLSAEIRNINGQKVRSLNITGNHNEYTLDLPAGIYMISMQFENGMGATKLVVE